MRKLKKGVPPSPVNYSLMGKFTHNNGEWFVYQRELSEESTYCNLKVIHPAQLKSGSANIWIGYKMGNGDNTTFVKHDVVLKIREEHPGLESAIMAFCRAKMPETFN